MMMTLSSLQHHIKSRDIQLSVEHKTPAWQRKRQQWKFSHTWPYPTVRPACIAIIKKKITHFSLLIFHYEFY